MTETPPLVKVLNESDSTQFTSDTVFVECYICGGGMLVDFKPFFDDTVKFTVHKACEQELRDGDRS